MRGIVSLICRLNYRTFKFTVMGELLIRCTNLYRVMVSAVKLAAIFLTLHLVKANFTRISRENVLLSRRRRYLNFPMGSNFVITISHIKLFLQVQPRGWAILLEADVPFALPTDTRKLKKSKRHVVDRKNFLDKVKKILTGVGLDGEVCSKKIMCSVLQDGKTKGKSLIRDLLYAAFIYPEDSFDLLRDKCNDSFSECSVPLLEYLMGNPYLQ